MRTRVFSIASTLALAAALAPDAAAQIRITEYMYDGPDGEFVELTNVGSVAIDVSGWSIDDVNAIPGSFPIGAAALVQPGEVVVVTESAPNAFRAAWNLPPTAKVVGDLGLPNGNSLGRNDEINLWNGQGVLADRLTFGDETFPGSIRTQNVGGWSAVAGLGTNDAYAWTLATAGDAQGSYVAVAGDVGSPGSYVPDAPTTGLGVVITEYMYSGPGGEFVEFTNLSASPVDMTDWSFDDVAGVVGTFELDAFGVVQPNESVVLTESDAAAFRANWNLAPTVKVIGGLGAGFGHNYGRNDQINVYDAANQLVDRLTYGDQTFPGTIRTTGASGWTVPAAIGTDAIHQWVLATVGDAQQSVASTGGAIGNPGRYPLAPRSFCSGDGSGAACPCGNASALGAGEGCLNSFGLGGKLVASGGASLAADTLVLAGSQMPNSSALYFQGTQRQSGGAGAVFGDGLRCAGGTIVRLGTKNNLGGASAYPVGADLSVSARGLVTSPGARAYQCWYRNAASFCATSTFNLTNGVEVVWTL